MSRPPHGPAELVVIGLDARQMPHYHAPVMSELAIATLAVPGTPELDALLLVASLRRFGARCSDAPVWVLVPESVGNLTPAVVDRLSELDAEVVPFPVLDRYLRFPLAAKIAAAAAAEDRARESVRRLAYCDRDTLFVDEPSLLATSVADEASAPATLAYRPVHHRLIGSAWNQPIDPFWRMLFSTFDVPDERLFQMRTHTGEAIRPYVNAGHFSVDPNAGLMRRWAEAFEQHYRSEAFTAFYEQDQRYAIFAHQTILTGVLLRELDEDQMRLLPAPYNYPLHLHDEVADGGQDNWVAARHEDLLDSDAWRGLPLRDDVVQWLVTQPRVTDTGYHEGTELSDD